MAGFPFLTSSTSFRKLATMPRAARSKATKRSQNARNSDAEDTEEASESIRSLPADTPLAMMTGTEDERDTSVNYKG